MSYTSLQFEVQQLRMKNIQRSLESILMLIAALFITALLPSLLLRYVYSSEQLLTQPRALEVIPVVAFAIAVGYFLFTVVTNLSRDRRIAKLENEMAQLNPAGEEAELNEAELVELEAMVEQALEETAEPKKTTRPARKAKTTRTRRARK